MFDHVWSTEANNELIHSKELKLLITAQSSKIRRKTNQRMFHDPLQIKTKTWLLDSEIPEIV